MRIKKKTRALMLAASACAVIGIAAVSFAAWSGTSTELTASANTGSAYLQGFDETTLTFTDKLVPWNQTGIKEGETIVKAQLPAFTAYGNFSFTVSDLQVGTITENVFTQDTSLSLNVYVLITPTALNQITTVDPTAQGSEWKLIGENSTFGGTWTVPSTALDSKVAKGTYNVALMLVSESKDAAATKEMGKAFQFKITLNNNL